MICTIAGVIFWLAQFSSCGAVLAQYSPILESIPAEHRRLVTHVEFVWGDTGTAWPDGTIQLPYGAPGWALAHEIGHLVGWSAPARRQIMADWWPAFGADTSPTEYGRINTIEDFAESYRLSITGDLAQSDPMREEWLASRVFVYANKPAVLAQVAEVLP